MLPWVTGRNGVLVCFPLGKQKSYPRLFPSLQQQENAGEWEQAQMSQFEINITSPALAPIKNSSRGVGAGALEQGYAEAEACDSGTKAKVREQSFMGFLRGCNTTGHYSSGIWQSSGA